jgi:NAD(P)-dependent dehydrogenase (short-subunit alcohol dehydrogenase family)
MEPEHGRAPTARGSLHDRLALVTGAAAGIGRAITDRFVADGAVVIAGDLDAAGLDALQAEHGDRVIVQVCDVTEESSVATLADLAIDRGGLDIAVANAGKGAYSPIVDHPLESWQEIIDLCLTGVFLTVKHAGRVMNDGGSIVNIASLNAIQPAEGMAAYCTAKAGVAMLTRVAAMELGHRRIRVNTVAPGLVQTNATSAFFMIPGVVEEFVENTTVGRFAQPADIASMVAFLAGPGSDFVSAGFFSVDGGASTKRYPDLPGAFSRLGDATAP